MERGDTPDALASTGVKYDTGKAPLHFLPPIALRGAAAVFGYGATKYAAYNFMKGMQWTRLYDAAMRHMTLWLEGEDIDPESNLPHLDHALCCLMMLKQVEAWHPQFDDRPPRDPDSARSSQSTQVG